MVDTPSPDPAEPAAEKRPSKREQTKEANRQAILDAARLVFAELGYGATSVRDIIRRTGLASGTFYNYFKSKEEVFEALMDQNALTVRPRLRESRVQARSFEEFVRNTFRIFFEFCKEDKGAYAVMRRNAGHLRVRVDTPEVIAGFEELQDDIERAVAAGLAPDVDARLLTGAIVGVAFELADRMTERDPMDVDAVTDFATALFLQGVKGLPSAGGSPK